MSKRKVKKISSTKILETILILLIIFPNFLIMPILAQPPPAPPINISPIPEAGSNKIVYENEIVYFDASESYDPDGEIILYGWDFGDNTSTSGITTDRVYTTEGNYTITLIIRDNY